MLSPPCAVRRGKARTLPRPCRDPAGPRPWPSGFLGLRAQGRPAQNRRPRGAGSLPCAVSPSAPALAAPSPGAAKASQGSAPRFPLPGKPPAEVWAPVLHWGASGEGRCASPDPAWTQPPGLLLASPAAKDSSNLQPQSLCAGLHPGRQPRLTTESLWPPRPPPCSPRGRREVSVLDGTCHWRWGHLLRKVSTKIETTCEVVLFGCKRGTPTRAGWGHTHYLSSHCPHVRGRWPGSSLVRPGHWAPQRAPPSRRCHRAGKGPGKDPRAPCVSPVPAAEEASGRFRPRPSPPLRRGQPHLGGHRTDHV